MKPIVQAHFKIEVCRAKTAIANQDLEAAWIALQRAHILGQTDAIAHTLVHLSMLKLAWKQRDFQEMAGQIMPTLLAIPLTLLFGRRRALRGGKANTKESEKLSISTDIQQILNQ